MTCFNSKNLQDHLKNCSSGGCSLPASIRACPLLAGSREIVSSVETLNSCLEGTLYTQLCNPALLNVCHEIFLVSNLCHCSNTYLRVNRHTLNYLIFLLGFLSWQLLLSEVLPFREAKNGAVIYPRLQPDSLFPFSFEHCFQWAHFFI